MCLEGFLNILLFIKVVKVQKVCIFYPWRFFIAIFDNIQFLRNMQ